MWNLRDKMEEVREWGHAFIFLKSTYINIFVTTTRGKGAWDSENSERRGVGDPLDST